MTAAYNPVSHCIDIRGRLKYGPPTNILHSSIIDDTQLFGAKNDNNAVSHLYGEWELAKNAESHIYVPECCSKK